MMKTTNNPLTLSLAVLLCAALLLTGGCTKLKVTDCSEEIDLFVEVVGQEGEDITDQDVVRDLSLYVFDKEKRFLQQLYTYVGEPLKIYFPDQEQLHIVSWGNLSDQQMELPSMWPGMPMHEATLRLLNDPRWQQDKVQGNMQNKASAASSIAISPDDLFYSYDEISLKTGKQTTYKLAVNRKVGSMSITMRNLQSYANRYDDNYSLVVRDTYNAFDFYGQLTGDKVGYGPAAAFNDKKELVAPLFNLLPSDAEGTIEIDVYHDGELITTIKNDWHGQSLKAEVGKVLNVLVDFRLQVNVEVSMTSWGVTHIWKDF